MACEKKTVSSFTVKFGLVLLAGCILVPISLATMFRHSAVPLQTLSLLFSVGPASRVMWGEERLSPHRYGRNKGPVRCDFSSSRSDVCLGLEFHKEMSVDAARTAGEYSMADFTLLARRSYGLTRDTAIRLGDGNRSSAVRPRLLLISRKSTRAFTNAGAIARAATALGFEVVVGEPARHADLPSFARVVNSCDVLVGVHGAGLANLVFLPAGAVVVQVVPLGGLDAMAAEDFGAPARDAGLRYVHYGISVEESTLARRYPRDHRVLRDPAAVRREGWMALRAAYLVGQNVTIDVRRFGGALRRAMEHLR